MLVDPRRDHSFRIPRPELTQKLGTPNSCNQCHKDKSTKWASQKLNEWFPERDRSENHFAITFAQGQKGDPKAQAKLLQLASNPKQPVIIRATAISLLRRFASIDCKSWVFQAFESVLVWEF